MTLSVSTRAWYYNYTTNPKFDYTTNPNNLESRVIYIILDSLDSRWTRNVIEGVQLASKVCRETTICHIKKKMDIALEYLELNDFDNSFAKDCFDTTRFESVSTRAWY